MNNKYKIVFIDIDGTLVNDEKIVPEENLKMIQTLKKNGIEVVLASGRPYHSIEKYSTQVGAIPYIIGSNGGIVANFVEDKKIFSTNIEKENALEIAKLIKENNIYFTVTISGNLLVEDEQFSMTRENRNELVLVNSLEEYLKTNDAPVIKFSLMDDKKENLQKVRKLVLDRLNIDATEVDEFMIPKKYRKAENNYKLPYVMDIMPKGISKAKAIEELCKYLGIEIAQTVVFGDGLNDIEMFNVGGYKVAMGNAADQIKELADVVTKTNNEAGVAYELNKIFGIE